MWKYILLIVLCLNFGVPIQANAEKISASLNVSGNWKIDWSNNTTNAIKLTQSGMSLTGFYINDSKDKCPVSGRMMTDLTMAVFKVTCPKWNFEAEGLVTHDGKTIVGRYQAYGDSYGSFYMSRK